MLITAGPTREKIDDVRYISNYSSGKMGYALAEIANLLGFEVYLVSGPVSLGKPDNVNFYPVESAEQMYKQVMDLYSNMDIIIMSAAVADFKPKNPFIGKIKKNSSNDSLILELEKTKDILYELGTRKKANQTIVGFALESSFEIENGIQKLNKKNCDLIIVNSANKEKSGFGGDFNTITIIDRNGLIEHYQPMLKMECAKTIIMKLQKFLNKY